MIAMQLQLDNEKIRKKENLSAYYYIQQHLAEIDHIICKKPHIEIYGNGMSTKSFEIPLREIGLFFEDKDLLQIRINSYVNPNNIYRIQKTSRTSYEIVTSQGNRLPIGKTFLNSIKTQFPQLFKNASGIH
jgi:DNA-binding LytR/AlgR family response regulator